MADLLELHEHVDPEEDGHEKADGARGVRRVVRVLLVEHLE